MSSGSSTRSNNQPKTAKEVIAANVHSLIEQLEAGHSEALTGCWTRRRHWRTQRWFGP